MQYLITFEKYVASTDFNNRMQTFNDQILNLCLESIRVFPFVKIAVFKSIKLIHYFILLFLFP